MAKTLEEAMATLKRDPAQPVQARIENLDVELRVVGGANTPTRRRGSKMAALGPWQGLSTEQLLEILHDARSTGGSSEPPKL